MQLRVIYLTVHEAVHIEDSTFPRVRCHSWKCQVEHEKIKLISTSGHVIFCLLYKHTNDDVFDDFPKISENFPNLFQRKDELFGTFFGLIPKISEEGLMMLRSDSNTSKYFLRDSVTIAMVIILVTMETLISSRACDEKMIS